MEECNICLTNFKKKNVKKHCLTKKHKYFSNLFINKYIVRDFKHKKTKEIILTYLNNYNKKIERFTVRVVWKKDKVVINVVNKPNMMILQKSYMGTLGDDAQKTLSLVSCDDYLSDFYDMMTEKSDKIHILFTSDLKDITFFHYMQQPKSMPCRKLIRKYLEGKKENFDYIWLPNCFRQKILNFILYKWKQ